MARRRKRKPMPPRRLRMKRAARLSTAKSWMRTYKGKNIVRGYRKHYGVDLMCAIVELQKLGAAIDPVYIERVKVTVQQVAEARRKKKLQRMEERLDVPDSDATFAYIAGYTAWGFPYGVTWEELEQMEQGTGLRAVCSPNMADSDDELPF